MATDSTIETCLTESGLSILAQSQLGETITFTKLEIGDGELGDTDAAALTELISPVQELEISSSEVIDTTTISITAVISQSTTGYTFREIGLYAADPDTGEEVLYAYGNKGDSATYIPANTSNVTIEEEVTLVIEVGNSTNVVITIASTTTVQGQGIPPSVCTNLNISEEDDGVTKKLTWKDPEDTVIDSFTLCTWAGTMIRKKSGSYPANETDGEFVISSTTRNAYATEALVDEDGSGYYYKAFPYSTHYVYGRSPQNEFGPKVYEFIIDDDDSSPSASVIYTGENENYTPAYMDFDNDEFNYGSWEGAFFLSLFRPCMLKTDGTVDYYLDPNDFALQEDGETASDITNTDYDGNAMVQVGQIWIKEEETSAGRKHIYIANCQVDEDYDCWTHLRKDGTYNEYYYRAIYDGSKIDSVIRSLSGQTICKTVAGDTQMSYAQANGDGWNVDEYNYRRLINYLLVLMGKSLNTQDVFGTGRYSGGSSSSNNQLDTGTMDKKGMFWGDDSNSGVKVFYMENWWGNIWKFTNGIIQSSGSLLYKMCEGTLDGSTEEDYNTDGTGYIDSGVTLSGTISELYITKMELVPHLGLVPTSTSGGSSSTYYCDGLWSNSSVVGFARFGSLPTDGLLVGAFSFGVHRASSYSSWYFGVALSYKPL